MRKSEIKQQLSDTRNSLNSLVRLHDLLTVAGNEQREIISELKATIALYEIAFVMSAGRLFAHLKLEGDPTEFTKNLLIEAQQELEGRVH